MFHPFQIEQPWNYRRIPAGKAFETLPTSFIANIKNVFCMWDPKTSIPNGCKGDHVFSTNIYLRKRHIVVGYLSIGGENKPLGDMAWWGAVKLTILGNVRAPTLHSLGLVGCVVTQVVFEWESIWQRGINEGLWWEQQIRAYYNWI